MRRVTIIVWVLVSLLLAPSLARTADKKIVTGAPRTLTGGAL
jgi:hypothetical protein